MKPRTKQIIRFILVAAVSFILIELVKHLVLEPLGFQIENIELGWLTFIVIFGFKFHIICCILPMLWAAYKCRHKCDHDHCDKN